MSTPLRIAVISQHGLTRAGLSHLIGLDPARTEVVTVQETADGLADHDVAIYDLAARDAHAVDLRHLLRTTSTPVVALVAGTSAEVAARLLAVGVACVVSMDVTGDTLIECLEKAAAAGRVSPAHLRERTRNAAQISAGLTEREVAVLELVAAGRSNEQIASELYLSINTVKTYIRSAYKRIGATSRSQAVIWALRHGLGLHADPTLSSAG